MQLKLFLDRIFWKYKKNLSKNVYKLITQCIKYVLLFFCWQNWVKHKFSLRKCISHYCQKILFGPFSKIIFMPYTVFGTLGILVNFITWKYWCISLRLGVQYLVKYIFVLSFDQFTFDKTSCCSNVQILGFGIKFKNIWNCNIFKTRYKWWI